MKSVKGFKPELDLIWNSIGHDYFRTDADGKHTRLNANGVFRDKKNATQEIFFSYTGVVEVNDAINAVLSFSPDAKTTKFGSICTFFLFSLTFSYLYGASVYLVSTCCVPALVLLCYLGS